MKNFTYSHYELNFSNSLMQLNSCCKCRPRKQPRQPTTMPIHPICNSTMICFSNSNSNYRRRKLQLHMRSVFIPVLLIPISSFQKALAAQQQQSQPSTVQMYHQQLVAAAAQPQTQQTASSSSTSTHRPAMLV